LRHPLDAWWSSWLLDRAVELGGEAPYDPTQPGNSYDAYVPVLISSLRIDQNGFALAGGQSGNPFSPHYADLLDIWVQGRTVPLQDAARPQDLKDVEGILVLMP